MFCDIRSFHFIFSNSFLNSVRVLVQNLYLLKDSKKVCIAGLLFLFTVVGCGGPKGPAVTVVSGTVMLDGEPLDGASVVFHPTSSSGLAGAGKTSADGTFGLTTFRATPGAGVVPGEYVSRLVKKNGRSLRSQKTMIRTTNGKWHRLKETWNEQSRPM